MAYGGFIVEFECPNPDCDDYPNIEGNDSSGTETTTCTACGCLITAEWEVVVTAVITALEK